MIAIIRTALSCTRNGAVLLASALLSCVVTASDITPNERSWLYTLGPWPTEVPRDPGNEFSGQAWAERLGQRLFESTALSGDGTRSCASCHDASRAFSDGLPVSLGAGVHVRNTQGLLDVGLQRWFGWDGGTDSLWAATLRPILSPIELDGTIPVIAARLRAMSDVTDILRRNAHLPSDDEALLVSVSKVIAAYLRTLRSDATDFDRFRDAVVNGDEAPPYAASARRGFAVFIGEGNCVICHYGPNFSNREFHDTGRPFFTGVGAVDPGRYSGIQRVRSDRYNVLGAFAREVTDEEKRKTQSVTLAQANFGQWRTPSLRNLVDTAPYMHDGSLATLRDVVDAYADVDPERLHSDGESLIRPLNLDEQAREDLVAFLRSLSVDAQR